MTAPLLASDSLEHLEFQPTCDRGHLEISNTPPCEHPAAWQVEQRPCVCDERRYCLRCESCMAALLRFINTYHAAYCPGCLVIRDMRETYLSWTRL